LFVLGTVDSFTLVDGECDNGLVILDGGESSLLDTRNWGVSGNNYSLEDNGRDHTDTENVSFHCNSHTQRSDVQQQKTFSLLTASVVGKDSGLNGGTVGDTLIRVDGLVQGSATKDIGDEFLDLGDTSRSTNQDNIVDIVLVNLGVFED
jgi:hypothetical protein